MAKKRDLGSKPTIFDYHKDESSSSTEFRRLARNIRHRGNPSEIRSILITSATKNEGKSLIASNLAIAIAKRENEKTVLLIDFDLRRPAIYSLFGMDKEPGVVSLLAEEAELSDVVRDTELDNLKVLTSGRIVDSPSQLLANTKGVLDKCRDRYDILVCDAPPVIPVDDVGLLAPHLDGVLLVVLAGKTDRVIVKRAVDIIGDAKAQVLGVALNNLHGALPYYYDYGYYRYRYERKEEPEEGT